MVEGVAATIARSHFRVLLRTNGDDVLPRRGLSKTRPALCICLADDATSDAFIRLIADLHKIYPAACIVILSNDSGPRLKKAFDAGANGCLPRTISPQAFLMALDLLLGKQVSITSMVSQAIAIPTVIPEPIARAVASSPVPTPGRGLDHLSSRELQVLDAITKGQSNKHIARRLDISDATVKAHIRVILRKIGAENRTQAAVWALGSQEHSESRVETLSPEPAAMQLSA
ncbi:response regulator transcription factor [Beijerinckia sp. L45]|uniref:response regulator transcription factor n=1 Tax=Beijerinckia sp. L45 TaxID=1641855 RepID=UPI00131A759E|nr:response regulator transcription factor [Beijerinckia sp. L45]